MADHNLYIPEDAKIVSVKKESETVKTYRLKAEKSFKPGQFFQVSVLGAGEAPISVSSSPAEKRLIELTVRNIGKVTSVIHNLTMNDSLGLRGPFGNFFPVEDLEQKDLIFVAGGIGLAPLRSLIKGIIESRNNYGRMQLLYGARTQDDLIFKDDLKKWLVVKDFDILLTIDKPEKEWNGNVGVVTTLFNKIDLNSNNLAAFVCGPPVMMRYTIFKLVELGVAARNIFVTLERYMKCGVGKCGHCYIANKYVCTDGPVFTLEQLKEMKPEEIIA